MYQRILVPIDGSPLAQRGFEHALGLAKACKASLLLLHVVESYPMMAEMAAAGSWDLISTNLREYGQRVLDEAHGAARDAGVASEARLEDGVAARVCDVIVDQAKERHCDLIVMGTQGRRGISRALLGSDAESVVHISPVPVLLVRAPLP
jgi:nucleotide-binding universal stress UspA family protein